MKIVSLIAALDENNGIGYNNQLLTHLPADLNYFKSVTMGKPIIMGRLTYESIGKPLPGRQNIIISRTLKDLPGVLVFSSLTQGLEYTSNEAEVMIIGGAQLFNEALLIATRLYITRIHHHFTADVYFPAIDLSAWECKKETFQAKDEKNPYDMTFYIYERI